MTPLTAVNTQSYMCDGWIGWSQTIHITRAPLSRAVLTNHEQVKVSVTIVFFMTKSNARLWSPILLTHWPADWLERSQIHTHTQRWIIIIVFLPLKLKPSSHVCQRQFRKTFFNCLRRRSNNKGYRGTFWFFLYLSRVFRRLLVKVCFRKRAATCPSPSSGLFIHKISINNYQSPFDKAWKMQAEHGGGVLERADSW